ncbi:hypothetical protein B0H11DRAFT_1302903 [Mycena galericulata]|nr:hypothetical protein B0H11DRAFT_1302903 [Mycena galericulata]
MNHPVNVQRSASESPPVTPPRRAARPPLSPNNRPKDTPLRRHPVPFRRAQKNAPITPQTQSLGQANARLIHERLQQNHNRLQVQLHARQPAGTPAPSGTVKAFLDTTLRSYAARFHAELTSMRAACLQLIQREQHHTAEMRGACARLAHERDVAEGKLRVLLERRARAGKRTRAQVEEEEAEAELEATGLLYPPSPVSQSPPQLPTQSPPPRLLSPFVLAARRSPSYTPDPEDHTGFDLTVACDTLPRARPSKKRRVSDSSERTLVGTPSDDDTTPTKERETCPPAGSGECDMDLESESESEAETDADARTCSKSRSQSRAASDSPPSEASTNANAAPPLSKSVTVPPSPPPPAAAADKARLDLEYVDIMYLPTDGKLVCRVCLLAATTGSSKHAAGTTRIQAFVPGASWEMLRTHCEEAHPEACRDVVGLGRAGVRELRRRLGLGLGVGVRP